MSEASNPRLVSSIATPLAITPEFFLHNDRLVTISGGSIRVFDVSDRSQPSEMAAWTIRGAIQEARIDDGQLLVFMENRVQLPAPEVVWYEGVNPGQKLTHDTFGVFGRFESESEYLARVSPELAELFFTRIADGTESGDLDALTNIEYEIAGDWQDFVFHTDALTSHQTFVAMFDVDSDAPSLVDTEIINGLSVDWVHIGEENVHIAGTDPGPRVWRWDTPALLDQTWLASLDLDDGEVRAVALGGVEGTVTGSTGLDEHDGLLRVVTTDSDLYVLDEVENRYEIVGELLDFADGQEAFGAYFNGERALVTTSVVENLLVLPLDPLHVIDLSDPTAPLELSELDIPGVVSSLHWVGEDHFVGVGFAMNDEMRQWSTQVTLYDVSDLANPLVVENWVNKASSTGWLMRESMLQPESITFDSSTRTLLVSPHRNHDNAKNGALAFHIDLQAAEAKVQFLGRVAPGQFAERTLVIDEAIAVLSEDRVGFYDIEEIDEQLGQFFTVKPEALGERITISSLGESSLDVLSNERINGPIRITHVSESRKGAEVSIAEDELSLIYTPTSDDYRERLTYTIEDQLGNLYQAQVNVHVPKSQFNDVVVDYDIRITDENGDPVSEAKIGDRLWIELSADEVAEQKHGIFQ
ncbi:MAG: beta-propeller domain-containing protein, partial [Planctomycetota bacterium]